MGFLLGERAYNAGAGRRSAATAGGRAPGAAMEQLAPQAVGVASGPRAPRRGAGGAHAGGVGPVAGGEVLIAVADVEDLQRRVGEGFAPGAPGAGNEGTIEAWLAHRRGPLGTRRRDPSAVTVAPRP